uniref:Reverse transcriptase domain-containing protein n=1 Tax=Fagus sylvatica TaxID=28930 RepID=A0A2N9IJ10_FAGSY
MSHPSRHGKQREEICGLEDPAPTKREVVSFYQQLLGHSNAVNESNMIHRVPTLMTDQISDEAKAFLQQEVNEAETRSTMLSLGSEKAPVLDGFTAYFFKKAWPIVGRDVCQSVKSFFQTGCPPIYVHWIRECITNPRFSIAFNGSLVGYFKGGRAVPDALMSYVLCLRFFLQIRAGSLPVSIFILPKKIVKAIEQKFNPFLWRGPDDRSGAKVCWEQACLPKEEGGLGLKRVED